MKREQCLPKTCPWAKDALRPDVGMVAQPSPGALEAGQRWEEGEELGRQAQVMGIWKRQCFQTMLKEERDTSGHCS